jgi:hypothetical protein
MTTPPTKPLNNLINSSGTLHPNLSSSSLISPVITKLSDPSLHLVDSHLLDLLLSETIRILIESTKFKQDVKLKQEREITKDLIRLNLESPTIDSNSHVEVDELVKKKIEHIGFKLGYSTAECLTRDRQRFPPNGTTDTLELIKFVCKDLWVNLFDKQVDNLRTNHRGVYVLLDNRVRFLERLSSTSTTTSKQQVDRWSAFVSFSLSYSLSLSRRKNINLTTRVGVQLLKFPEGIIRGALANLGIQVTVSSESNNAPQGTIHLGLCLSFTFG